MAKKLGVLDLEQRVREKQAQRDADTQDLASGRRSAKEINRANSMFGALDPSVLRNAKIIFPEKR